MDKSYSIKQSTAIVVFCLITKFSFGQVSCQNGVDYNNSCNPYKIKLLETYKNLSSNSCKKVTDNNSSLNIKTLLKSSKKRVDKSSFNNQKISSQDKLLLKNIDREVVNKKSLSKVTKDLVKKSIVEVNTLESNKKSKTKITTKVKNSIKLEKKSIYLVKQGSTLLTISKQNHISIKKLRELNLFSRNSIIKLKDKIYLKPIKFTKLRKNSISYWSKIKFNKIKPLRYQKRLRVTATAYTSHRNQTDSTPFLAAWNNRLKPGMKIIAVSHDLVRKYGLKNGVRVKIKGLRGYYIVRDKMNKRFRKRIDIYMGLNKRRALRWGKRRITLYW